MSKFYIFVFLCVLASVPTATFAQSGTQEVAQRQQKLQVQLNSIETQIAAQQKLLNVAQGQHQTLQTQINAFNAEIRKTQLQIKAINITITKLSGSIYTRNKTLSELSSQLSAEKESLAQILRQTQMIDNYSVVSVALGSKSISNFFSDLDAFTSIKRSLEKSFTKIRETSNSTKTEKVALQSRLVEQEQLRTIASLAKRQVLSQQRKKKRLLKQTKGIETNYQKLITSNRKTAAQIRSELFTLRGTAAIPFGTALTYAQTAEKATGTRPALTLAILKQETNLGENLGTGTWKVDMSPKRDQPIFTYITSTLGLDPYKMPVSKKPWYGWGGAMGPGQFIPSTWVCYGGFINTRTGTCAPPARYGVSFWKGPWKYVASKDRVRKLLGTSVPSNPWKARVAIMATAMLMADNGGAKQTYYSERLAALRYFAGWKHARNPAYAFYGDGVMRFASYFQKQINQLKGM